MGRYDKIKVYDFVIPKEKIMSSQVTLNYQGIFNHKDLFY